MSSSVSASGMPRSAKILPLPAVTLVSSPRLTALLLTTFMAEPFLLTALFFRGACVCLRVGMVTSAFPDYPGGLLSAAVGSPHVPSSAWQYPSLTSSGTRGARRPRPQTARCRRCATCPQPQMSPLPARSGHRSRGAPWLLGPWRRTVQHKGHVQCLGEPTQETTSRPSLMTRTHRTYLGSCPPFINIIIRILVYPVKVVAGPVLNPDFRSEWYAFGLDIQVH